MDTNTVATNTAGAVTNICSYFMLDGNTYKRGGELGFEGLDFYVTGRGGVLGDVDADVVTAAFAFLNPDHIRKQWELGKTRMSVSQAAEEFAGCAAAWAEANVPDDIDAARLGELAAKANAAGRVACAPVFAGWRHLPVPDSPKAAAIHHLNGLRELRQGIHAACVIAAGLSPLEAVSLKDPGMAPVFGWSELVETEGLQARWDNAEQATSVGMAHAFETMSDSERTEFAQLANDLYDRLSAG